MGIIATPLGWIMKLCYYLVKNYGIALLLFTIITRAIVFPLTVKQQKSSAKTAMLNPELQKLQKKYGKNKEKLQEEQMKLYSKAGINPMASCLPMVITMVILFALIPVIYGPLTYVSNLDKDDIENSNNLISNLYTVSSEVKSNDESLEKLLEKCKEDTDNDDEVYKNLREKITDEEKYKKSAKISETQMDNVIEAIKKHNDIDTFMLNESYFSQSIIQSRPELMTFVFTEKEDARYADVLPDKVVKEAEDFNYEIFGLFMGKVPTWKDASCAIPIISFLLQLISMFVSQHYMKKNNPEAAKMSGCTNGVLYVMPLFSLWLTFSYPVGLGLYWCYSSLLGLAQTVILNKVYTPEHVAELIEKDNLKKKASGKQSFMEKVAEAQMIQSGKNPEDVKKALAEEDGEDYVETKKKSKSELKEEQRRKLNEARKRMAEKYGDEYNEND